MMDTSSVADSLPLTTLSMGTALLQWGLNDMALDNIGFYFDTFVRTKHPRHRRVPPAVKSVRPNR